MSMYTESLRAFLRPVLAYLDDESVTEIMINGPADVWIERKGRVYKTDARFTEEGLLGAARNMAQFVGRPLSDERPRLDARLPDGSRIHVVLPPVARRGTTIAIRKFFKDKLGMDALVRFDSLTPPMARLLEACIRVKLNTIVSGGTGSGKTTLLNILSSLIPNDERILTIEDSAELQLNQDHLVAFESRPPDKYGKGEVNMGDLLHSALRLRPDRIVVGEVRGGESFFLMQAMNTGHGGTLATVHANTPTDTLRRLEALCLMSAVEMPLVAVRAQVASAIQLVVCCERLFDGSRKVTAISEVLPLDERGEYRTQDLWLFTPLAKDSEGNVLGYHAPTGIVPNFVSKARAYGYGDLTDDFFDPATYGLPPPPVFQSAESVRTHWVKSLSHREKGLPDPDDAQRALRALEARLREEAERKPRAPSPSEPAPAVAPSRGTPEPPGKASAAALPFQPPPEAPAAAAAPAVSVRAPNALRPASSPARRLGPADATPPRPRPPAPREGDIPTPPPARPPPRAAASSVEEDTAPPLPPSDRGRR